MLIPQLKTDDSFQFNRVLKELKAIWSEEYDRYITDMAIIEDKTYASNKGAKVGQGKETSGAKVEPGIFKGYKFEVSDEVKELIVGSPVR